MPHIIRVFVDTRIVWVKSHVRVYKTGSKSNHICFEKTPSAHDMYNWPIRTFVSPSIHAHNFSIIIFFLSKQPSNLFNHLIFTPNTVTAVRGLNRHQVIVHFSFYSSKHFHWLCLPLQLNNAIFILLAAPSCACILLDMLGVL